MHPAPADAAKLGRRKRPDYQSSAIPKLPSPKPLAQVHTHASYEYCDEGDAFRTASYLANMKQPGAMPHSSMHTGLLPSSAGQLSAAYLQPFPAEQRLQHTPIRTRGTDSRKVDNLVVGTDYPDC